MNFRQAPATATILGLAVLTFLLGFLQIPAVAELAFSANRATSAPWTLLTYPFAQSLGGSGFLFVVLGLLWLWQFGSWVEQHLGTSRFVLTWLGFTLAGSALVYVGGMAGLGRGVLAGTILPASCLTMIWCARNSGAQVMFFGLVPLKTQILALITAGFVLFGLGTPYPALGFLLLIPLAVAYFVIGQGKSPVRRTDPTQKRQHEKQMKFVDKAMDRQKEREERERLRKLFESSLDDDRRSG